MIFNALIKSQFSYCPLLWMFCSRQMINKIHKTALRIVLNYHIRGFESMLWNINDISSHHRNIQTLLIELFKMRYELAYHIVYSALNTRSICCKFRNLLDIEMKRKRTVIYDLEHSNTIRFLRAISDMYM